MNAQQRPIEQDGLVIVGDEAYTAEEWAATVEVKAERAAKQAAKQAAYRARPEVKAKQAAYRAEMRHLARLAREAGH